MAKKQGPPDVAIPGAEPSGKGKIKLIVAIVLGLLLAVGLSVASTLYFMNKDGAGKDQEAQAPELATSGKQPAIYEVLAPAFVVNFSNNGGRQRYMQVSVALMSRDQVALDGLKEHMPLLRNQLVMLFSSQDFAAVATPVGQEMLRQQATASVQELAKKELGKLAIEQVLFTNFVLQ